jgi:hypothetical protein
MGGSSKQFSGLLALRSSLTFSSRVVNEEIGCEMAYSVGGDVEPFHKSLASGRRELPPFAVFRDRPDDVRTSHQTGVSSKDHLTEFGMGVDQHTIRWVCRWACRWVPHGRRLRGGADWTAGRRTPMHDQTDIGSSPLNQPPGSGTVFYVPVPWSSSR